MSRPSAPRPGRSLVSGGALALMTVGSVGYLGSAPATAVFGLASVFLYVLPAIVFLLPVSLVAAALASGWEGGVYNWILTIGILPPLLLLRFRKPGWKAPTAPDDDSHATRAASN